MDHKWWWYILRTVQIIWVSPAAVLVWLGYILPMWWVARDLVFVRWAQYGVAEFVLADKGLASWHVKLWGDWAGWGGPCVFVWRGDPHAPMGRTRLHELEHCRQQFYAGVFFYPFYLVMAVVIWLFVPGQHAYLDNPFERAARRAAGQPVDVAPTGGWVGRDRWPWW